jgi:hypothetical protein
VSENSANGYTANFKFSIGQRVKIKGLDPISGTVYACCDRGNYKEYRVVFWNESKRCDEWLIENELEGL